MNNQEVINILRNISDCIEPDYAGVEIFIKDKLYEAAELAISALEAQQADTWIPISSGKLPEERITVDITIKEKSNEVGGYRYYTGLAWYQDCKWIFKQSPYEPLIVAWRYRPKPWKEEQS